MVRRTWYSYDVCVTSEGGGHSLRPHPHTPPIIYEGLSQSIRWNLGHQRRLEPLDLS